MTTLIPPRSDCECARVWLLSRPTSVGQVVTPPPLCLKSSPRALILGTRTSRTCPSTTLAGSPSKPSDSTETLWLSWSTQQSECNVGNFHFWQALTHPSSSCFCFRVSCKHNEPQLVMCARWRLSVLPPLELECAFPKPTPRTHATLAVVSSHPKGLRVFPTSSTSPFTSRRTLGRRTPGSSSLV